MTLGEIIKKQRQVKGYTQSKLAEGICSKDYIYKLEKNKRVPSIIVIKKLSDRLELDLYKSYFEDLKGDQ